MRGCMRTGRTTLAEIATALLLSTIEHELECSKVIGSQALSLPQRSVKAVLPRNIPLPSDAKSIGVGG